MGRKGKGLLVVWIEYDFWIYYRVFVFIFRWEERNRSLWIV